jgi:hypothetical protein
MKKNLLKLLYRSFDDQLSLEEQAKLKDALSSSEEMRREKFAPFFADRVMQKIRDQKETSDQRVDDFLISLILSFRKIALTGAVIALLLLTTNFISGGGVSVDTALALQQMSIEDIWSLNDLISEIVQ